MMLLNTIGIPSAPICTEELDLLVSAKRITSRPPSLTQERVTPSGRLAGNAGARSAAASTVLLVGSAVTAVRDAELVTFCQAPVEPARTRRVMSPSWK